MRRNQHLITDDVVRYMTEYEVWGVTFFFGALLELSSISAWGGQASGDPDVIGRLVLLLADWYFAWAPGGE
jgi:anaphase-promoting complex subunit 2